MAQIDPLQKVYYCPLKGNRRVDASGGTMAYQGVDELAWTEAEGVQGKLIKVRGFPKDKKASAVSGSAELAERPRRTLGPKASLRLSILVTAPPSIAWPT